MFFVAKPPNRLTTDYTDSADNSVIAEHPCSSVTSVVKNSESDSVSSVFSVGTLPTVFTTDHTDTIRINPPPAPLSQIPSIPHPLPIRGKKALVDSEPVNHGSHGYDLDKTLERRCGCLESHPLPIHSLSVVKNPIPSSVSSVCSVGTPSRFEISAD